MLRPAVLLPPLLGLIGLGALRARQPATRLRFAPGRESVAVSGSVVRGEVASYVLGARAGQRMQVRVNSVEGNAVFQLYPPRSDQALPRAAEGADARRWSGRLPTSGDYRVVVGSTRGNASFRLHVSIK